jgi:Na+-driven multidrug efflux pump
MIFGYFGLPAMGVAGAALATVLGQSVAALTGLVLNLKQNPEIHLSIRRIFRPSAEIIGRIYFVGVPSILMMSIGSLMNYLMNRILISFSETATAVFGVYFRLQSFFFMPVFGLNNGLIPVLAYNYGAKSKRRIDEALRFSLLLAFCVMCCGTLIFEFFPRQLLLLFNASEDMMGIGSVAMRIIALNFPLAAVGIILGSVFQAFSRSYYSLIISLCRQLIILIPAAWLIARITGNVSMVWWSFPLSEVISAVLSIFFFRKVYSDVTSSF